MIYQILLQCSVECCKCSPTDSCNWEEFLLNCSSYFGKAIVVILLLLITVGVIICGCIFLIWVIRRFYLWYKYSMKPYLKDSESICCLNELRELNRNLCNIRRTNNDEVPDKQTGGEKK